VEQQQLQTEQDQLRKKSLMLKMLSVSRSRQRLCAWNSWSDFVSARRCLRRRLTQIVARMRSGGAARAWQAWSRAMDESSHMRAADERSGRIVATVLGRMRNARGARAWGAWRRSMAISAKARVVLVRWREARLARGFTAWLQHSREAAAAQRVMAGIIARMLARHVSAAFDSWHAATAAAADARHVEARRRSLLRRAVMKMLRRVGVAAMLRWKAAAVEARALRGKARKVGWCPVRGRHLQHVQHVQ